MLSRCPFAVALLLSSVSLAGSALAAVRQISTPPGWRVSAELRQGHFYRCFAEATAPGSQGLTLSIMANLQHHLSIDDATAAPGKSMRATATLQPGAQRFDLTLVARDGRWATAKPLTRGFDDALEQSKTLEIAGRQFSLGDTTALFSAFDGCLTQYVH